MNLIPHITLEQYEALMKHRGMLNITLGGMNACIVAENNERIKAEQKTQSEYRAVHYPAYKELPATYFSETMPSHTPTESPSPTPSYSSGSGGDFGGGGASGSWSDSSSSDSSSGSDSSSSSD